MSWQRFFIFDEEYPSFGYGWEMSSTIQVTLLFLRLLDMDEDTTYQLVIFDKMPRIMDALILHTPLINVMKVIWP